MNTSELPFPPIPTSPDFSATPKNNPEVTPSQLSTLSVPLSKIKLLGTVFFTLVVSYVASYVLAPVILFGTIFFSKLIGFSDEEVGVYLFLVYLRYIGYAALMLSTFLCSALVYYKLRSKKAFIITIIVPILLVIASEIYLPYAIRKSSQILDDKLEADKQAVIGGSVGISFVSATPQYDVHGNFDKLETVFEITPPSVGNYTFNASLKDGMRLVQINNVKQVLTSTDSQQIILYFDAISPGSLTLQMYVTKTSEEKRTFTADIHATKESKTEKIIDHIGHPNFYVELGKFQTNQWPSLPSITPFSQSPLPSSVVSQESGSTTQGWQTYKDLGNAFTIQYPSGWREVKYNFGEDGVGFGPQEIQEDVLWAVTLYYKPTYTYESLLAEFGKQFPDKVDTQETITVDGITMTKVTTTSPSQPDWQLVSLVIERWDRFLVISNGAITDENLQKMSGVPAGTTFEQFYTSFKSSRKD